MVDSAAEALINSLPEEDRAAVKESTATTDDSSVEHSDENQDEAIPESEKLKNKVAEFGKEAIKGRLLRRVLSSLSVLTSYTGWCHGFI